MFTYAFPVKEIADYYQDSLHLTLYPGQHNEGVLKIKENLVCIQKQNEKNKDRREGVFLISNQLLKLSGLFLIEWTHKSPTLNLVLPVKKKKSKTKPSMFFLHEISIYWILIVFKCHRFGDKSNVSSQRST